MMALSGLGIASLPKQAIEEDLRKGTLVNTLPKEQVLEAPFYIVHNYGLQVPTRIRAFIEHLKNTLNLILNLFQPHNHNPLNWRFIILH